MIKTHTANFIYKIITKFNMNNTNMLEVAFIIERLIRAKKETTFYNIRKFVSASNRNILDTLNFYVSCNLLQKQTRFINKRKSISYNPNNQIQWYKVILFLRQLKTLKEFLASNIFKDMEKAINKSAKRRL